VLLFGVLVHLVACPDGDPPCVRREFKHRLAGGVRPSCLPVDGHGNIPDWLPLVVDHTQCLCLWCEPDRHRLAVAWVHLDATGGHLCVVCGEDVCLGWKLEPLSPALDTERLSPVVDTPCPTLSASLVGGAALSTTTRLASVTASCVVGRKRIDRLVRHADGFVRA